MMIQKKTILAIAAGLVLAGCGGSDYVAPKTASTTTGKAVDGYVSGALVVCDANNDGIQNNADVSVYTNTTGDFDFSTTTLGSCPATATVFAAGGTNIDTGLPFKGLMKAKGGSKVITPLTTLMVDGGMTAAQVAVAMGLPADTDIANLDPVLPENFELQKKTLAVQLILQQSAETLGSAAGDSSPAAIQAIYSEIAKSLGATLAAATTPLISTSGAINPTLVATVVTASVASLKTSTNPVLATAKVAIAKIDPVVISSSLANVATQAQTLLAVTTPAALTTATTAIANTAFAAQTNFLSLNNDSIVLNGDTFTLANFASTAGVTLAKKVSPLDTVSFGYTINGTAIPANANGVMTTSVKLGIDMSDATRKLQFILDQADVSITNGVLAVSVPSSAKLYAYGKTSSGATANVTLTNVAADQFITVSGNQLSFNAGKVLNKLAPNATFSGLQNITGTFNMKMAISNLNIVGATATSVQGFSVAVTGTSQAMSGLGVQGKFTVK